MPRNLHRLNARIAKSVTESGRHADGGGLYLSVDKAGRRRWTFMFVRQGRQSELGFGSAREVSLVEARLLASAARLALREGRDPRSVRQLSSQKHFGEVADEVLRGMRFKNSAHQAQWFSSLNDYSQSLRNMPVDAITTDDVLAVLRSHWHRVPETANRLRGRIERVLDAAAAKGLRTGNNPARWKGHLDAILNRPKKLSKRGHHAALNFEAMPTFMARLRSNPGMASRALEFTILTAARTSETLGARWNEIDIDARDWVVPASRMKGGEEHRVPLSDQAVSLLQKIPERSDYIFYNTNFCQLSTSAMSAVLKRLHTTKITVHGFRSSFRDWCGDATDYPRELAETALAHKITGEVERAYRRGSAIEKRRVLMQAWADFCSLDEVQNR